MTAAGIQRHASCEKGQTDGFFHPLLCNASYNRQDQRGSAQADQYG
jgi:hypothetical protein